jgi:hypothetical protein
MKFSGKRRMKAMSIVSMSFSRGTPELAATIDGDLELSSHPSRRYARPADVLADSDLSVDERRAVLASWASDACAVDSTPALRRSPFGGEPVTFDEIMNALIELDRGRTVQSASKPATAGARRRLAA